jgi:hypothetical protein
MNLLEGLASLDEAEGPTDDEIRAELAAQGIDMDAWADEIQAKAEAQLRAEEAKRKERDKRRKSRTTWAVIAGGMVLALAAGGAGVGLSGVATHGTGASDRVADQPKTTDHRRSREIPMLGATAESAPPVPAPTEVPDAGPARPPGKP